jgi:type VI secretion system secreted protein Hcp
MAESIWMSVKGAKQGDIKSETTAKGREGLIECIEFEADMESPHDVHSGLATGKRQHKPLVVRKRVDKTTPLLSGALVTNETLSTVKLQFWRPKGDGSSEQFYTIELTNAGLSKQKIYLPMTLDPTKTNLPALEKLEFVFQKIVWTFTQGGITASDDWESPV